MFEWIRVNIVGPFTLLDLICFSTHFCFAVVIWEVGLTRESRVL